MEHLDARSNGGKTSDENTVACCKAANTALGNLPVKEKLRVVLSHKGASACPALTFPKPPSKSPETVVIEGKKLLPKVIENLRGRGAARPKTRIKLRNSLATTFKKTSPKVIEALLELLKTKGYTADNDGKVTYPGL